MKGLKAINAVVKIVAKYGAIVMALVVAIQVFSSELDKIDNEKNSNNESAKD